MPEHRVNLELGASVLGGYLFSGLVFRASRAKVLQERGFQQGRCIGCLAERRKLEPRVEAAHFTGKSTTDVIIFSAYACSPEAQQLRNLRP